MDSLVQGNQKVTNTDAPLQDDSYVFPFFNLPLKVQPPKPRLAYWEDFLTQEEINLLLNLEAWKVGAAAKVGGGPDGVINTDVRRSKTSWITGTPETHLIFDKLLTIITDVNETYFGFDLSAGYEKAQLSLYTSDEHGNYDWHIDAGINDSDNSRMTNRKLSISLLLSDPSEFEGGELQIKTGLHETTLEAKQGRAWFFPSFTLHRVTPVTKGIRKSLVLWIGGPQFR